MLDGLLDGMIALYLYKGGEIMKINKNGVEVRQERDETKTVNNNYYLCKDCNYKNTDIKDVAEEKCWNCGSGKLEWENFVSTK